MLLRFVTDEIDSASGKRRGLFQVAARLRDSTDISAADHHRLRALFDWFNANLEKPTRMAASNRPRAKAQAISWFRDTAREHLVRMWEMVEIVSTYGVMVEQIRTARPGYVVYEDDFQVTALPFDETRT